MRLKKLFSHDDGDCSATIKNFMEENLKFLKDRNINDVSGWGKYKTEEEWKEEEERNKQSNAEGGGSANPNQAGNPIQQRQEDAASPPITQTPVSENSSPPEFKKMVDELFSQIEKLKKMVDNTTTM